MLKCKSCGFIPDTYSGKVCPRCKERYMPSECELKDLKDTAMLNMKKRNYPSAIDSYRMLADFNDVFALRELASIYESGQFVTRDLSSAERCYFSAALLGDAYSAFKYSRLADGHGEKSARFWLLLSSVLGAKQSYPFLSRLYSKEGKEKHASYYTYLCALCDDSEAIASMAKRYAEGIGVLQSYEYAKWYIDKLSFPPINAIRLAYRLRSVCPKEAPAITHPDYDGLLYSLAEEARVYGYDAVYFCLCNMLSEKGDAEKTKEVGILTFEGKGTRRNTERAIEILKTAGENGSASAYKYLADSYLFAKINPEPCVNTAIEYYKLAAELGDARSYEVIADLFCEGRLVERSIPRAIDFYEAAARGGASSARVKANSLKLKREEMFKRALTSSEAEAFKLLSLSASMGFIPAYKALASAYGKGVGVKANRRLAFLWYKRAAAEGDSSALYPLGLCYAHGFGTRFCFENAKRTFAMAAEAGSSYAKEELSSLLENKKRHMTRAVYSRAMRLIYKRLYENAKESLEICEKLNFAKGIYMLGCLFEFGLGTPTDRQRASELYSKAASLGFRDTGAKHKSIILKMSR